MYCHAEIRSGLLGWLESARYIEEGWGRWKYHTAIHTVDTQSTESLDIDLPLEGAWRIVDQLYDETSAEPALVESRLNLPGGNAFRGFVFLLKRA